ncbi:hypothetical protein N7528_008959 [Penicillium herquei]|nr:hypothetical protein N7528_008959 [Penicillium herquei]
MDMVTRSFEDSLGHQGHPIRRGWGLAREGFQLQAEQAAQAQDHAQDHARDHAGHAHAPYQCLPGSPEKAQPPLGSW